MSELLVIASRWPGGHCRTAWDESPLRIEPDNSPRMSLDDEGVGKYSSVVTS